MSNQQNWSQQKSIFPILRQSFLDDLEGKIAARAAADFGKDLPKLTSTTRDAIADHRSFSGGGRQWWLAQGRAGHRSGGPARKAAAALAATPLAYDESRTKPALSARKDQCNGSARRLSLGMVDGLDFDFSTVKFHIFGHQICSDPGAFFVGRAHSADHFFIFE